MSTQQEAQERARKWVCINSSFGPDEALPRFAEEYAFLSGEISGHQRAMEEMSAKSAEGFEDFFDCEIATHDDLRNTEHITGPARLKYYCEKTWQAGRAPLLARIAELEKELEISRKQVDLISAAANRVGDRYTDLEAQNKKLGDVVLEMAEFVERYQLCPIATLSQISHHANLIDQL